MRERWPARDRLIPIAIAAFLGATALGSSRNYGLRYLLPLAPLAIVWVSALAERPGWRRRLAWAALVGPALAVASTHPDELTYFNALAGGRMGGRAVLADSNLDWGQGLEALARLQHARPELADITLYYFGDTEPRHFGVAGTCHVIDAGDDHPGLPPTLSATTPYVAVSASLHHGPWGPAGYFRALDSVHPYIFTDDTTIAVYRTADVPGLGPRVSRGRDRGRGGLPGRRRSPRSSARGRGRRPGPRRRPRGSRSRRSTPRRAAP